MVGNPICPSKLHGICVVLIECEKYYIESGSLTTAGTTKELTVFPYFDNYNVVTGSFPTANSDSLLFNNENASYGEIPNWPFNGITFK